MSPDLRWRRRSRRQRSFPRSTVTRARRFHAPHHERGSPVALGGKEPPAGAASSRLAREEQLKTMRKRILVVDNHAATTEVVGYALRAEGFDVDEAHTRRDAQAPSSPHLGDEPPPDWATAFEKRGLPRIVPMALPMAHRKAPAYDRSARVLKQ
jgi:hypothetical protein